MPGFIDDVQYHALSNSSNGSYNPSFTLLEQKLSANMKGGNRALQSVDPAVMRNAKATPAVGSYDYGNALRLFAYDKITSPKITKGDWKSLIDDKLREKKGLPGVGSYDISKSMNKISKNSSTAKRGRFG